LSGVKESKRKANVGMKNRVTKPPPEHEQQQQRRTGKRKKADLGQGAENKEKQNNKNKF